MCLQASEEGDREQFPLKMIQRQRKWSHFGALVAALEALKQNVLVIGASAPSAHAINAICRVHCHLFPVVEIFEAAMGVPDGRRFFLLVVHIVMLLFVYHHNDRTKRSYQKGFRRAVSVPCT